MVQWRKLYFHRQPVAFYHLRAVELSVAPSGSTESRALETATASRSCTALWCGRREHVISGENTVTTPVIICLCFAAFVLGLIIGQAVIEATRR
jgi:hypothetical protein